MIPFDNSSLVTPSPIVPMIFKEKENNHRRDSDQAQEDAMKNNHQRQGEENFGNEVMSEVERRNAATHWNDLFDDFKVFGNDYLELLSNFDLKSSTIDSTLDLIMTKQNFYLFYPADSIEFGHGRYLGHLPLYSGSLNSEEIPPDALRLYCDVRTIKIVLHSGLQISFDAFILGRISVNRIPTYWIVVLDEDKYLWALRANGVDEEEVEDDEDRSLDPDPAWPGPQYDEQKDLFGADLLVVRLCSLASLQRFRNSGQQFSPEPYYGVKCWTSRYTLVEGPAIAPAEES